MTVEARRQYWDGDFVISRAAEALHNPQLMTTPYDDSALDLTVFVSCYNEAPYIIGTLDAVRSAATEAGLLCEIIVIDDGSRDDSPRIVADYIAANPDARIVLRVNRVNKGLAQNYLDAAFLGRGKYYRLICGDNAEPRDSIVTVFKAIGKADIIVPYYATAEGKNLRRRMISKGYTWLLNMITGHRLQYYNGLAVHLRHNVMRWHPNTHGFGFQADILCLLIDLGFTYQEVEIITIEQRRGRSNALTFRNLVSVAHTLIEIGNRRLSNRLHRRR
jgi:glycosyltransferase involved in cell wall biosynthesis